MFNSKVNSKEINMKYTIIDIEDDYDLIDDIILLGDSQKHTLGFLPEQAFFDYANRNSIIAAVSNERKVLGYTLFAQKQNHICRLAHVCVDPNHRHTGIGNSLISRLKTKTANTNCIMAKCRRDYKIDRFWELNGFIAKGEKPGRGLNDTTLTIWEYRHRPSLLSLPPEKTKPLAVLDLNIIIEVTSETENECNAILSFTYADEIDFRISTHSYTEANRNNNKETRDITRRLLNSLQYIDTCHNDQTTISILNIIGQTKIDDAKQIASAVYNNADYFITKDTGLISHSKIIQKEFGLSIYTPTEFIITYCNESGRDLYFPGYLNCSEINFKPLRTIKISELFQTYKGPDEKKGDFEASLSITSSDVKKQSFLRILVKNTEIGICAQLKTDTNLTVRMLRLKKSIEHMKTLSTHIVENILLNSTKANIEKIIFTDKSSGRLVEQALIETGFQSIDHNYIRPIGSGFLTTAEGLGKIGQGQNEKINKDNINYLELENMLWPAKLDDLKIPIYIIPIKPIWTRKLLTTRGHQLSLFGAPDIILQTRRVYYRSKEGINIESPGRIVWYASGENNYGLSKCAIGVSFINNVETGPVKKLFKKYERLGVYSWKDMVKTTKRDLNKNMMAILFSKTEIFYKPIHLRDIKTIIKNNEDRSFNPVSPFKISCTSFRDLYETGTMHGH